MAKQQRIRDPVHDLIEFTDDFEQQCWQVVQTAPFQRLRRIKQLGFSEIVYPGATHSRLAHSLGVYHTAKQLTQVVKAFRGEEHFDRAMANAAVAAGLVHDIGHGPFSHAFEHASKLAGVATEHEDWSVRIIKETEVRAKLEAVQPGFADRVAKMVGSESPSDVYASIVSSQFDADRLDYIRRDRMMTGTQHGAIDFRWLLANLRIGRVRIGQDGTYVKEAETFVLAPKCVMAAEAYVLGLFQLYPTVYLHKTTRGAESIFSALLVATLRKILSDDVATTGLPDNHALVRFARNPADLDAYLALDDSTITGALPLLRASPIPIISNLSARLLDRRLYKCIDVTQRLAVWARDKFPEQKDAKKRRDEARAVEAKVRALVAERHLLDFGENSPQVLEDVADRSPYKLVEREDGALNRIWAVGDDEAMYDLGQLSLVVSGLIPFHAYRLYYGDDSGKETIEGLMKEVLQ